MSRLRNLPQSGPEAVAQAISGVSRQVRSVQSQQVRMIQRGYSYGAGPHIFSYSQPVQNIVSTEMDVTIPTESSQLRVYAEARFNMTISGGEAPVATLLEDGVELGPLIIVDDTAADDGRVVATGSGFNPGAVAGGGYYNGSWGYAIPPWGFPRQYQPGSVGTHTYSLGVVSVDADGGAAAASGQWEATDLKMWLEVL